MVYEIIRDSIINGMNSTGVFYQRKEVAEKECEKLNKYSFYSVYKVVENDSISTLGLIENKD